MSATPFTYSRFVKIVNLLNFDPKDKELVGADIQMFFHAIEIGYSIMTNEERAVITRRLNKSFSAMDRCIYEDIEDWIEDMKKKGLIE